MKLRLLDVRWRCPLMLEERKEPSLAITRAAKDLMGYFLSERKLTQFVLEPRVYTFACFTNYLESANNSVSIGRWQVIFMDQTMDRGEAVWVHRNTLEWLASKKCDLSAVEYSVLFYMMGFANSDNIVESEESDIAAFITVRKPAQIKKALIDLAEKGIIKKLPEGGYRLLETFGTKGPEPPRNHLHSVPD